MGFPILVRQHLYIELGPSWFWVWRCHLTNARNLTVEIRALSQYKDSLFMYGIPIIKIRQLWDHLIFTMGTPILVRYHLYTETAPRSQFYLHNRIITHWSHSIVTLNWPSHFSVGSQFKVDDSANTVIPVLKVFTLWSMACYCYRFVWYSTIIFG